MDLSPGRPQSAGPALLLLQVLAGSVILTADLAERLRSVRGGPRSQAAFPLPLAAVGG